MRCFGDVEARRVGRSYAGLVTARLLHTLLLWAALAAAPVADVSAQQSLAEPSCLLACVKGRDCRVQGPAAEQVRTLADGFTALPSCHLLKVGNTAGAGDAGVVMRYRHQGQWFEPPAALMPGTDLQAVLSRFRPDPCGVPTRECMHSRLQSKTGSAAGHGVDGQTSTPAGTGEPCLRGLPCGPVLPPPPDWTFRLVDASFDGIWQVWYLRGRAPEGQPAQLQATVRKGVIKADGRFLQPGAVMAYLLATPTGQVLATGEFEVVGATRLTRLQRLAEARAQKYGLADPAAWIDVLAAAGVDWNVQQLLEVKE